MAFRNSNGPKKKAHRDKECFNYHKLGHFRYNCCQPNRKLARIGGLSIRRRTNNRSGSQTPHRGHQAADTAENSDNVKPFAPGLVGKACIAKEEQLKKMDTHTLFLKSYTSRYLCNNRKLFRSTYAKNIDFVTTAGQVIQTNEISTVALPLSDGKTIKLQNMAYASECDLNLISRG